LFGWNACPLRVKTAAFSQGQPLPVYPDNLDDFRAKPHFALGPTADHSIARTQGGALGFRKPKRTDILKPIGPANVDNGLLQEVRDGRTGNSLR
jgi:hypothetical protein